jgi:PucR-like helix-turn-helix protein/diguanylate cyclase with GGDEF domain
LEALHEIRAELVARLRARSGEIEATVYSRVRRMADPAERDDPEYRAYLRATVAESIDYALLGIERGEEWEGPIPEAAMVQARRAARTGVKLDAILRRYAAGDRLVGEFVVDEAAQLPNEAMRPLVRAQGPHVDRMMAAVATEYMEELERIRRSPAQRVAERVQRLLAADSPADAAGLDYELDAWHLGLVITSSRPDVAARTLSAGLNRQLLVVPRGNDSAWAWLGGRQRTMVDELERYLGAGLLGDVALAVGESHRGLEGWRLTHHEAKAAQQVMMRRPQPLTRASDVILLAAVLRDEMLAQSLREAYLAPLDDGDSGLGLRETLRAYFDAGFNAATAAAVLEVDRHTVQRRLRKVEEALGRLLHSCHAELEVALTLEELDRDAALPRLSAVGSG